jgi:hypothetical protein
MSRDPDLVHDQNHAVVVSPISMQRDWPLAFWIFYRDWSFLAHQVGDSRGESLAFVFYGVRHAADRVFQAQFDRKLEASALYGSQGVYATLGRLVEENVHANPEGREITTALTE